MRNYTNKVSPLFCLMADDALETELNVITGRLLKPTLDSAHPESDAHLTAQAVSVPTSSLELKIYWCFPLGKAIEH